MKPSEVNPAIPVWGSEVKTLLANEHVPFDIVRVGSFRSPKYGPTWRLTITRGDNRESGILLFAKNDVRDSAVGGFSDALESTGEPIGPCMLSSRTLGANRETWEIVDWEAAPTTPKQKPL